MQQMLQTLLNDIPFGNSHINTFIIYNFMCLTVPVQVPIIIIITEEEIFLSHIDNSWYWFSYTPSIHVHVFILSREGAAAALTVVFHDLEHLFD